MSRTYPEHYSRNHWRVRHFRYDGVSARKRGVPRSAETRAALSAAKRGKPTHRKTQDEKDRISAKLKGRRSPTTGMRFPGGIHDHQLRDDKGRYRR